MCELFGASLKHRFEVNSYLKTFYSHSNEHPHGWGLACINGNHVTIEKEPLTAIKSNYLKHRINSGISGSVILGHIRYATIGQVKYENCHPYTAKDIYNRSWTLIHNGTIFDYSPINKYFSRQKGDTDSERILLYIVDNINKNNALSSQNRFKTIENIINDMAAGNKLNLILYDGEYLYVHTNYRNSLYYLKNDSGILFSTQPLDENNWQSVTFTTLLVYKDGELVFSGKNHRNEYIDNAENTKYLYQIFSYL